MYQDASMINSVRQAVELFSAQKFKRNKLLKVACLNMNNEVIQIQPINSDVRLELKIKQVLKNALLSEATKILVVQKCVQAAKEPTLEEIRFAKKLSEACALLAVEFHDYLKITDDLSFFSFANYGSDLDDMDPSKKKRHLALVREFKDL